MIEKRTYPRTSGSVPVRLSHPSFGTVVLETRDIADGGVFITRIENNDQPKRGDILQIKLEGFMTGSLREVDARVVRVMDDGFAMEFMQSPFDN